MGEAAQEDEWLKLPTHEKVAHKAWKARLSGYEECIRLFTTLEEKDKDWTKYNDLIKGFVADSIAVAQEKGLEAAVIYCENCATAPRMAPDICKNIVAKSLGSTKTKTRDLGRDILIRYVELEKHELVMENLIDGLGHKTPKIVIGCLTTLTSIYRDFGTPKPIPIKPIVKKLPGLMEHRNKEIREETKQLIIELYRWIREAIRPSLSDLKPLQITELNVDFEQIKQQPQAKPSRYLRSEKPAILPSSSSFSPTSIQPESADGPSPGMGAADQPAPVPVVEIDPWDLLDPVDITPKLQSDFHTLIGSSKWTERKEALEMMLALCETGRISPAGDLREWARILMKRIADDKNINIVVLAAKCLTGLGRGLRKDFQPHAAGSVKCCLEKFKEKKPLVLTALRDLCDVAMPYVSLEPLADDFIAALENKNPSVKAETCSLLARTFRKSNQLLLNKKLLKIYCPKLVATLNDTAPDVRDAAVDALASVLLVVGDKSLAPYVGDVDSIKMAKINDCKAKLAPDTGGQTQTETAAAAATTTTSPPTSSTTKTTGTTSKPAGKDPTKPTGAKTRPKVKPAGSTKPRVPSPDQEVVEPPIDDGRAVELLTDSLGEETLKQLRSTNWKERLEAINAIVAKLKVVDQKTVPVQAYVRVICASPGLKDSNFQVANGKFETVGVLARGDGLFSKTSCEAVIGGLVEKIGDLKTKESAQEALFSICEAVGLDFVAPQVLQLAFAQKNVKTHAESLNWLIKATELFGYKYSAKSVLPSVKLGLSSTNPAVRQSAVSLIGLLQICVGSNLRTLFEGEKPALLQLIDAEIERRRGDVQPAPTRMSKADRKALEQSQSTPVAAGSAKSNQSASSSATPTAKPAIGRAASPDEPEEDLVDRRDVADRFTDQLLDQMSHTNWKERLAALNEVQQIVDEVKFITPNLGGLPSPLRGRLTDSNMPIKMTSLAIVGSLAGALGRRGCRQQVKAFLPDVLRVFGDAKPQVRAKATAAAQAWLEQAGLRAILDDQLFIEALQKETDKKENPMLRAEIYAFMTGALTDYLMDGKSVANQHVGPMLQTIWPDLEHRDEKVRKRATELLTPFMLVLGYPTMARSAGKLPAGSQAKVTQILDKCRDNLPALPTAAAPVPSTTTPPQSGPPATSVQLSSSSMTPVGNDAELMPPPAAPPSKKKPARLGQLAGAGDSAQSLASSTESLTRESDDEPRSSTGPQRQKAGRPAGNRLTMTKRRETMQAAELDAVSGDLFVGRDRQSRPKSMREKDEKAHKVLKWNFSTPEKQFVEQLRQQMSAAGVKEPFTALLFHTDFAKHNQAIDAMGRFLDRASFDVVVDNLDLQLKWFSLRFFDTNPSMINKALEYLYRLFQEFSDQSEQLTEWEANSFLPYLVLKLGEANEKVRRQVANIFIQITNIYPASHLARFFLDGIKSKNAKQRAECIALLDHIVTMFGVNALAPPGQKSAKVSDAIRLIGAEIGNRDRVVRDNALQLLCTAYKQIGDQMTKKFLCDLKDKDMAMLEERIRRDASRADQETGPLRRTASALTTRPSMIDGQRGSSLALHSTNSVGSSLSTGARSTKRSTKGILAKQPTGQPSFAISSGSRRQTYVMSPNGAADLVDPAEVDATFVLGDDGRVNGNDAVLNGFGVRESPTPPPSVLPPVSVRVDRYKFQWDFDGDIQLTEYSMFAMWLSEMENSDTDAEGASNCVDACRKIFDKLNGLRQRDNSELRIQLVSLVDSVVESVSKRLGHLRKVHLSFEDDDDLTQQEAQLVLEQIKALLDVLDELFTPHEAPTMLESLQIRNRTPMDGHIELCHENRCFALKDLLREANELIAVRQLDQLVTVGSSSGRSAKTGRENMVRVRLNDLLKKICENADQTAMFRAIIQLLVESLNRRDVRHSSHISHLLVMLRKLVKQIKDRRLFDLQLSVILIELHDFFTAFPISSWSSDPMQILKHLKTTMYKFVESYDGIVDIYMGPTTVDGIAREMPEESEVRAYVMACQRKKDDERAAANRYQHLERLFRTPDPSTKSEADREFRDIMQKLASPNSKTAGLEALYELRAKYDHVDLNPMFAKAGADFRSFVVDGLIDVAQRRFEADPLGELDRDNPLTLLIELRQLQPYCILRKEHRSTAVDELTDVLPAWILELPAPNRAFHLDVSEMLFGRFEAEFDTNDPLVGLQRLYEWRGFTGSFVLGAEPLDENGYKAVYGEEEYEKLLSDLEKVQSVINEVCADQCQLEDLESTGYSEMNPSSMTVSDLARPLNNDLPSRANQLLPQVDLSDIKARIAAVNAGQLRQ